MKLTRVWLNRIISWTFRISTNSDMYEIRVLFHHSPTFIINDFYCNSNNITMIFNNLKTIYIIKHKNVHKWYWRHVDDLNEMGKDFIFFFWKFLSSNKHCIISFLIISNRRYTFKCSSFENCMLINKVFKDFKNKFQLYFPFSILSLTCCSFTKNLPVCTQINNFF